MKLNKKLVIGLAALSLSTFVGSVNADNTYEISKFDTNPQVELVEETGSVSSSVYLKYTGVDSKYTNVVFKYLDNNTDSFEVTNEVCNAARDNKSSGDLGTGYFETFDRTEYKAFYADKSLYYNNNYNKGVIIATRYDTDDGKFYCTYSDPVSFSRDSLISESSRYQLYFIGDLDSSKSLSVYPLYPYNSDLKVNVKIGKATTELIKKFANKKSDAYSSLLAYAKNDSGLVTLNDVTPVNRVDSDLKTSADSFYYVYVTTNITGDNFYNLDDVYLVQSDSAGQLDTELDLSSYMDSTGEIATTTTTTKTTSNPKTGVYDYLIPGALIVVLFGGLYLVISKKDLFKRI